MGTNGAAKIPMANGDIAEDSETTVEIKIRTLDSETYTLRVNKRVSIHFNSSWNIKCWAFKLCFYKISFFLFHCCSRVFPNLIFCLDSNPVLPFMSQLLYLLTGKFDRFIQLQSSGVISEFGRYLFFQLICYELLAFFAYLR